MKRKRLFETILAVIAGIGLAGPAWAANTNADYSGTPPFISGGTVVPSNVLLMIDNSGSMEYRATCESTENQSVPYTGCPAAGSPNFSETTSYLGMYDSLRCYNYSTTNNRFFATGSAKAAVQTACDTNPGQEWDGNFLNWVTFTRYDSVKKALIGGSCAVTRDANGNCPPSGSPARVTLKGNDKVNGGAGAANVTTPPVLTGSGANHLDGRVPKDVQDLRAGGPVPSSLVFHRRANGPALAGSFCVADAADPAPVEGAASCVVNPLGFTEQQFVNHVAVGSDPQGVIHQVGDRARFGLIVFAANNEGGQVLTPIGSRQSIEFNGTTVTLKNSNKAAIIEAVEQSYPYDRTPLAETLYEGIRYIAQVNSVYAPGSYRYPIAFSGGSGGAAFQATGAGSLGLAEISALTGSETCPAGYLANACGRDPYFYGSNHTPAWASPSQVITCCKTYIFVMTDGGPSDDVTNIPASLQDYAHAVHGPHCTGLSASATPPAGTCTKNPTVPDVTLMTRHKTDYQPSDPGSHYLDDIAYWAHTNDLRKATIPVINEPGHDLPGMQNVNIYTFFAFGSVWGREILLSTAKQGGFEDKNGNLIPDNGLPDLAAGPCLTNLTGPCEYDKVIYATGAPGRDGIPDNFFASDNVEDLEPQILGALTAILQNAASGTAISVLSTSTTGEGAAYQAYFFPSTPGFAGDVKWVGYTQSLFVDKFGNLREDFSGAGCTGAPDGKLILTHDCIVKIRYDANTKKVMVDRYKDGNGDGMADTPTPFQTVTLDQVQPVWEAGRRLALTDPDASCPANAGGVACRRILTWVDVNNDGLVDATERIEFRAADKATLCPYLGGANVLTCVSGGAGGAGQSEAENTINFVRGTQVAGLRDRQVTVTDDAGAAVTKVWKLGDIIHATPVVVGAPRERFDILFGDEDYGNFYRRYKDRRQVAYTGANDGMLHAFNAGFFTLDDTKIDGAGDTVQVRFSKTPVKPRTSTGCAAMPCDASVTTYPFRTDAPKLGAELWGFIPQDLLPQLRWLTAASYDHVYYVDLKPKVTDARIFCNDEVTFSNCIEGNHADHPGGWGTVLIGGFRFGGSCTNCTGSKGGARVVTADFDGNGNTTSEGDARVFLSSYFVLDITNPEKDPVLLWTFRDQDLGLTTAAPAVVRIKPPNTAADPKENSATEKWYVVFGTGPTHFDGSSSQTAKIFVVDLKQGPKWESVNETSDTVRGKDCTDTSPCMAIKTGGISDRGKLFSTGQAGAFMGDAVTLDFDLDFRDDMIYAGSVICTGATPSPCNGSGPAWRGAMWRLATNGGTDPSNWGVSAAPTTLISTFSCPDTTATCGTKVGPIVSAPALSVDDTNNLWVFFGTGRFYSSLDQADSDTKHFFGVKDCNLTGRCTVGAVEQHDLFDASNVRICKTCNTSDPAKIVSLDGGATYDRGFDAGTDSLLNTVGVKSGWFITLPETRERNLTTAAVPGGTLVFTTFFPGTDVCVSEAQGRLYALYYLTGTPYKESAIGTGDSGIANTFIDLGAGVWVGVTVHNNPPGPPGPPPCPVTILTGSSNIELKGTCINVSPVWSRMLAWRDV